MASQGEDFKYLTLDDWTRQWTEQETQWHRKDISPYVPCNDFLCLLRLDNAFWDVSGDRKGL